jgi:hypothetical protein
MPPAHHRPPGWALVGPQAVTLPAWAQQCMQGHSVPAEGCGVMHVTPAWWMTPAASSCTVATPSVARQPPRMHDQPEVLMHNDLTMVQ